MVVSYMAFHFETLEAYYRGKLVLAACNGATDGSTIYILWTFVIAIIGPDKLLIPFTVLGFEMTVSFLCMMAVISSTSIYTVINLCNMISSKWKPYETQDQEVNYLSLSFQVASFMIWSAAWYALSILKTEYPYEDE